MKKKHDTPAPAAGDGPAEIDVLLAKAAADKSLRSKLLSGLGFYKLARRRQRQLAVIFGAVAAAHLLALVVFGGIVIFQNMRDEPTTFVTPPPSRTYEPRKLEHSVKVKKQQRSSSRPAVVPRIVSTKPSDIALPEIKMDPKLVQTSFQPKFKAVSGRGLGAGLGTGYGTAGFGDGVSTVNFFGIQAKGERIGILVDVSVSMVEDERGGLEGFVRVKNRVNNVVDALKEGTLFMICAFADGCSVMSPKLEYANGDTRLRAKNFIMPYNAGGSYGLDSGNYSGSSHGKAATGGSTRLDLALGAAMDVGCDTILIISDGMPWVKCQPSKEALAAYQNTLDAWRTKNAAAIAAYDNTPATTRKVWVPPQPARPAIPASKQKIKEGQPPPRDIPAQPAREGYWKEVTDHGGAQRPTPPQMPEAKWTLADFCEHIDLIYDAVYKPAGRKYPVVCTIGYQIDKEGHAFLKALAAKYQGQYRRVQSLKK